MSDLPLTRTILEPYMTKWPILSPATIYAALNDNMSQSVDLENLAELLSALLEDIESQKPSGSVDAQG